MMGVWRPSRKGLAFSMGKKRVRDCGLVFVLTFFLFFFFFFWLCSWNGFSLPSEEKSSQDDDESSEEVENDGFGLAKASSSPCGSVIKLIEASEEEI